MGYREEETRQKIFNAAAEKFSDQGADTATMQEIAKAAGVGKGTLYRYFENKEDLVSSLVEIGFDRITEWIEAGIKDLEDPVEKLEQAVEIQLEFYNEHRDFCKFLTRESLGYKDKFKKQIKQIRSTHTVVIEEIIKEGIEAGRFKDRDVESAAVALIGAVNITALHWFMFKEEFPVDKIKENLLDIYFEGMQS